jgi:ferrous iron transport protein A
MKKTLAEVEKGKKVRVLQILGGHQLRSRLEGMGLVPGMELKVIQNNWGPVLVEVFSRQIAIGRGQAEKIIVEEIS